MRLTCALPAVLVTVVLMSGVTVLADEKPLKVFVFAGQSNIVGWLAKVSEMPPELKGEQTQAPYFNGRQWTPLAPRKVQGQGFGPEISFAHKLTRELKEPIGIIKHGRGSSSLAEDWSPENPKSLYAKLVAKVNAAKKSRKIEIVGMLWMQGERDSNYPKMANAYGVNLAKFIERARRDFESPDMFFIAGRVNPPKAKFRFVDTVRKAQAKCRASRYAFIDCDPLKKGPDNVHYTTEGYVEMGYRFADGMLKLMKTMKSHGTGQ